MSKVPAQEAVTVQSLLRQTKALEGAAPLVDTAAKVFDYAQFLLDNDENLTKTGALTGDARERLRSRVLELLDGSEGAPEPAAENTEGT